MKHKIKLMALAAIGVTILALPATASAGEWKLDPAGASFIFASTESKTTTASGTFTCQSIEGSGKYNAGSQTTGTLNLTATGCHTTILGFTIECKTAGTAGTGIVHADGLSFHNVIISTGTPPITGILITPPAGKPFAEFECGGAKTVLGGTGIIAQVMEPPCNTEATTAKLQLESLSAGNQKFKQITTTGTVFDMTLSTSGGEPRTISLDSTSTLTFSQKVIHTC